MLILHAGRSLLWSQSNCFLDRDICCVAPDECDRSPFRDKRGHTRFTKPVCFNVRLDIGMLIPVASAKYTTPANMAIHACQKTRVRCTSIVVIDAVNAANLAPFAALKIQIKIQSLYRDLDWCVWSRIRLRLD